MTKGIYDRTKCKQRKKKGKIIKCKICNKEWYSYPSSKKKKYCSFKCMGIDKRGKPSWNKGKNFISSGSFKSGHNHPQWKSGICHSDGYIRIYSPNHPFAHKRDKYIQEHRLVMEQILGRYLKPDEIVHHKNGVRNDNRPENLILTILSKNWHKNICPKCGFEFLIK